MNRYLYIFLIFYWHQTAGQPPAGRYTTSLFPTVMETTGVQFSTNVPAPRPGGGFYESLTGYPLNVDEFNTTNVNLYMNIFQPAGDTLTKRPVVVVCFGGGFIAGSKDHWSIRLMAQELAKMGYVTAVIDYRLGMNIFNEELSMRAVYRGIQDGRSAVRFFKADAAGADIYNIDPDQIYIGGHSAGAFIATHNAYLDKETERPASTYAWPQGCGFLDLSTCWCADQGCLDCAGNNTGFNGQAKAVFSLAGALGYTSYIEGPADPKIVMFHSQDDDTVPYNTGQPFGSVSGWIAGFDLPVVYGSLPMSQSADILGLANHFLSYTSRGHNVHEETSSSLYSDIVPQISDWFFTQLLKPPAQAISGQTKVCSNALIQTYHAVPGNARYYHWEVIGGNIVNTNPFSPTVTIIWDVNAPSHVLKLTPFSKWDARGELTELNVQVAYAFQNIWTASSGVWNDSSNWSLLAIPEACHDVIIPDQPLPVQINILPAQPYLIRSLYMGNHVNMTISNPSTLIIRH